MCVRIYTLICILEYNLRQMAFYKSAYNKLHE